MMNNSSTENNKLSRHELYDLVWSTPLSQLAKKCPNCGQFKFEPDWYANNPGWTMIIAGVFVAGFASITPWKIVHIIAGIFLILAVILGIVEMFKKQIVITYKCTNCKFTEKYKKE